MTGSVHCSQLRKVQSAPAATPQQGACNVSMLCTDAAGSTSLAKHSHIHLVVNSTALCEEAAVPRTQSSVFAEHKHWFAAWVVCTDLQTGSLPVVF